MDSTVEKDRRLVGAWLERELADRLDRQAAAADRSRSAEIRQAIREHLRVTKTNTKERQ